MTTPTTTDHSRAQLAGDHSHGGARFGASRADRRTSFSAADFVVPNGREEEWRFTPIKALRPLLGEVPSGSDVEVVAECASGVTYELVDRSDPRLGQTPAPGDRAAALAWEGFTKAHVLSLPATSQPTDLSTLRITGTGTTATAQHIVVQAADGARGVVVLEHLGQALLSQGVEFVLGEEADVTVVVIHDWQPGTVHASSHRAMLGKDAHLKHIVITMGGDVVRVTPEATFAGTGGDVDLIGLYLTDSGQHHEHRLFVDHDLPNCRSRVTYKGALQGAGAHSVWVGDVLIRAQAEGTDTYELNRNLVLTEGARADSVPNLEIETGEIAGAGHASATGRFDDEQLFYLQARGIPEAIARTLVVHGFFAELVQRIGVPEIEKRLIAAIDSRLDLAVESDA